MLFRWRHFVIKRRQRRSLSDFLGGDTQLVCSVRLPDHPLRFTVFELEVTLIDKKLKKLSGVSKLKRNLSPGLLGSFKNDGLFIA